jgi:flagellin-like hook-associated protein FlgL
MSDFTARFTKPAVKFTSGMRSDKARDGFAAAGANVSAAGARITDVDSAREIIEFTRVKILSGAKVSVAGQANQSQTDVINLIQ